MQIEHIICPYRIEDKMRAKHNVTVNEARQVLINNPRIRFAEKGYTKVIMYTLLLDKPMEADI